MFIIGRKIIIKIMKCLKAPVYSAFSTSLFLPCSCFIFALFLLPVVFACPLLESMTARKVSASKRQNLIPKKDKNSPRMTVSVQFPGVVVPVFC